MTTPENPEQPDAKTQPDDEVEKKSVTTRRLPRRAGAARAAGGRGRAGDQRRRRSRAGDCQSRTEDDAAPPPWSRWSPGAAALAAGHRRRPPPRPRRRPSTISSTRRARAGRHQLRRPPPTSGRSRAPEPAPRPLDSPTGSTGPRSTSAAPPPPRSGAAAAPTALRRPGRGRGGPVSRSSGRPVVGAQAGAGAGFAMFFVWLVAVGVLYGVLGRHGRMGPSSTAPTTTWCRSGGNSGAADQRRPRVRHRRDHRRDQHRAVHRPGDHRVRSSTTCPPTWPAAGDHPRRARVDPVWCTGQRGTVIFSAPSGPIAQAVRALR